MILNIRYFPHRKRCFLNQKKCIFRGSFLRRTVHKTSGCLQILEEINNADSGAPCSPRHLKKKHFIDSVKKSLQSHGSSNKSIIEAGAITCVKLCKAGHLLFKTEKRHCAVRVFDRGLVFLHFGFFKL
jgi:hypothetical protein